MFFRILSRWAYPDPAMESITDGRQMEILFEEDVPAGTIRKTVRLSHHSNGLYYLMVEGNVKKLVRKLVLLK